MIPQPYSGRALAALALAALFAAPAARAQDKPEEAERPKLTLRSNPAMAFSPALITLTAELKGGDDDYNEFYCASIEWDWDDGTRSEASDDCEPYEAGKSEIKRRYATQHRYNIPGVYDVQFRLKQRGKVVASVSRRVTVRPGR